MGRIRPEFFWMQQFTFNDDFIIPSLESFQLSEGKQSNSNGFDFLNSMDHFNVNASDDVFGFTSLDDEPAILNGHQTALTNIDDIEIERKKMMKCFPSINIEDEMKENLIFKDVNNVNNNAPALQSTNTNGGINHSNIPANVEYNGITCPTKDIEVLLLNAKEKLR